MEGLLKDLDFVTSFKGSDGYMQFVHKDLMLEFIVPQRGRGSDKPFARPDLCVNAQPLRVMGYIAEPWNSFLPKANTAKSGVCVMP